MSSSSFKNYRFLLWIVGGSSVAVALMGWTLLALHVLQKKATYESQLQEQSLELNPQTNIKKWESITQL